MLGQYPAVSHYLIGTILTYETHLSNFNRHLLITIILIFPSLSFMATVILIVSVIPWFGVVVVVVGFVFVFVQRVYVMTSRD